MAPVEHRITPLEWLGERTMWWRVSLGLTPARWPCTSCGTVILEVKGRRSGRLQSKLVTWVEHGGARFLVTMPGTEPQWVKNLRAAGGILTLRHGRRSSRVRLQEVTPDERAPVLRAWYGFTALSANPRRHFGIDRHAPLGKFERIAGRHPVFRILPAAYSSSSTNTSPSSR